MSGQALPREAFGARLGHAVSAHGPLCVGIDAHPAIMDSWGLPQTPAGLLRLSMTVLEASAGTAAAIKPQVAWFERLGSAGIAVLEHLLDAARQAQVLTIVDAKRGDIGSTMEAYAQTWLGEGSPLAGDAVTLSPYLGTGSLEPAFSLAQATGRGTFTLALTSNPEGASVQHIGGDSGVAAGVVKAVQAVNAAARESDTPADMGGDRNRYQTVIGSAGLVVGATVGPALEDLGIDLARFQGPLLVPGYGAQGAGAQDIGRLFSQVSDRILVNSARGILAQGPDPQALRIACRTAQEELREALSS